jgi:hypothetical protein
MYYLLPSGVYNHDSHGAYLQVPDSYSRSAFSFPFISFVTIIARDFPMLYKTQKTCAHQQRP